MAVRAVVASHIVVLAQGETGPHGDRFLPNVGVGCSDNLAPFDQADYLFLKAADAHHAPQHLQ
jgi:hypothetical protein